MKTMTEHHDHRDDCPFKFATLDVCDCVEKNMLDRIEQLAVTNEALEAKLTKAVGLLGKSLVKEKRDLSSTLYEEISDFIEEIAEIKGESHE
jgi:Skp family chaperone for outer membrane proteins